MSTSYRLLKEVHACDLFSGCLEEFGVREHEDPDETDKNRRYLTDGRNYVEVYIDSDLLVNSLIRYGANAPGKILSAVADAFDTDIVSKYEPQFWGFDTQEECDKWMDSISKENNEKYHIELLKYLRGEPNDIKPGTIGMLEAEIAKTLVDKDPALMLPVNKERLRNEIRSIYDEKHAVRVTLGPEDIAFAQMISTHGDDLPSA